ncbi:glutaminyl-peptide cyclotransferase [Aplysia californica]|uniref:glutaminyl-peptide cyclotransferase n=1 Tax=Aplysia californica TaxID=6500 RepID=A0ABM1VQW2_APLCA|nr:glutaminyl-peptide cyclotransferase [Aplysia californica]
MKISIHTCYVLHAIPMIAFLLLLHPAHNESAKTQTSIPRKFRWVTKDSALRYLVQEMSVMDEFQKDILGPFETVRVSGTEENKKVQEHIKSLFLKWGWHVELDRFEDSTPYGTKEFTNIIATHNPNKPQRIVLACHFDSKYFKGGKFVAATDSAVPCAILLETVRQMQCLLDKGSRDKSSAKDISLQLVFFDGEEAFKAWTAKDSLYGARHLAKRYEEESEPGDPSDIKKINKIRELVLLDLIGTTDTQFTSQFSSTSDLFAQLIKTEKHLRSNGFLTGKHSGPIFSDRQGWGGIEDDHKPFLERGVDILHLISTPFPSVWHKMTDDWAHLDFGLIDDFSRIFRVFLSNVLHLQPEDRGCRRKSNPEL